MLLKVSLRIALAMSLSLLVICTMMFGLSYASNPVAGAAMTHLLTGLLWAFSLVSILSLCLLSREAAERQRMITRLQEKAYLDSLTGLNNHGRVLELLENECRRSRQATKPVSVLMLDLDHFKLVNDCFGHPVGDFVLAEIAQILTELCPECAFTGRYGGDEFVLVLADATPLEAISLASRLKTAVNSRKFSFEANSISLSISIGIATSSTFRETSRELITAADTALYEAKKSRDGRTIHHDDVAYVTGRV